MMITPDLLLAAVNCRRELAERYAPALAEACAAYGIDTPLRLAHFLAQVGHESGALHYVEEISSGEQYEGRRDLGNVIPGDGKRFKGRGLLQTTGRANYSALTMRLRARLGDAEVPDFVARPEALSDPRWAAWSAADYWGMRSINTAADRDDLEACTRAVNGGLNGLEDRRRRLELACQALQPAVAPSAPAPPKEDTMPIPILPAIASALLPTLAAKIPELLGLSEQPASTRRDQAMQRAVQVVAEAVGAATGEEAAQRIASDPQAAIIAREAVRRQWLEFQELGGGIVAARAAVAEAPPPSRNLALWVTAALLPLVYLVVGAVMFTEGWSQEVRAMVVSAVVTGVLGTITLYWLGTSLSSARKDEERRRSGSGTVA